MMMLVILGIAILFIVLGFCIIDRSENAGGFFLFSGAILFIAVFFTSIFSYVIHANNLGTIESQKEKIAIYEQQKIELQQTLLDLGYPEGTPSIALNKDSPITAIVTQLGNVYSELATCRAIKANSIISISQRKYGPWSFIVTWFGDKPRKTK